MARERITGFKEGVLLLADTVLDVVREPLAYSRSLKNPTNARYFRTACMSICFVAGLDSFKATGLFSEAMLDTAATWTIIGGVLNLKRSNHKVSN